MSDDDYTFEDADEVMKYLLTRIHLLQQFIKSKGIDDEDFEDFVSNFAPDTLH